MQLHARPSIPQLQQFTASSRAVAVAALSPRGGNGPRRHSVAASSAAVFEAVQQSTSVTTVAGFTVPLQPTALQTAPLSTGDFHKMFSLGETLGQGSYGTVRVCTHNVSGKQYAVKIISKRKGSEDRSEAILREIEMWSMLCQNEHIAELAGAFQDNSNIFIVQELLTGGDLQALLDSQNKLSEEETKVAMRAVLSALAACHAQEICYGDVKPSNFMLANMYPCIAHILDPSKPKGDMQLRLIDFGCAQICPEGCSMLQGLSGTPVYMAPEVIAGSCHSISMDVWAAGVMVYQMLTGQFPFWDTDMAGLFRIHPRKILKDIQESNVLLDHAVCAGLSDGAKDLIRAMLTKDPTQRITAQQALQHPWLQQ